jgi:CRISPR system Cascade subunit CasD
MSVLALQLAGPLQAWGARSRFARRTTENAPTKSGVIGLLAAALGRRRTDDVSDLGGLRYAVRVDQPGVRVRDFQTAHHADTGDAMPVSERFYLADAVFFAALEGDAGLIARLDRALRDPVFLPYLGRRSCPPARRVDLGVRDADLWTVIAEQEWIAADWYQRSRRREAEVELGVWLDTGPGHTAAHELRDVPLSFAPEHRRYAVRGVAHTTVTTSNPYAEADTPAPDAPALHHDPFAALGGD